MWYLHWVVFRECTWRTTLCKQPQYLRKHLQGRRESEMPHQKGPAKLNIAQTRAIKLSVFGAYLPQGGVSYLSFFR